MGQVMKRARTVGEISPSALEDEWQRRATAAAIEAARGVVKLDGPIPPAVPVGRLSDTEWGWVLAAMLFAWISARAEQAAAEQLDTEQCIRMTALEHSHGTLARSRRSCPTWQMPVPTSTGRSRSRNGRGTLWLNSC
jgi:hypothetical protein